MFLDLEHLKSCKILLNRVSFSASHTFYTVFAFVVKIYMQFFCTKLIGFRTHMRICNYKFFQSIPIFYHVMNALNFLPYFALGNSFVSHSLKFQQNTLELMNGICFEMPNCCFKCVLSAVHLCLNCFPAVICKVAKCSQFSPKKKKSVYTYIYAIYSQKMRKKIHKFARFDKRDAVFASPLFRIGLRRRSATFRDVHYLLHFTWKRIKVPCGFGWFFFYSLHLSYIRQRQFAMPAKAKHCFSNL